MIRAKYKQMGSRNATRALALAGLIVVGLILYSGIAQAATYVVDDVVSDAPDSLPGDGICEISAGGPCTLRAAIQEANIGVTPEPDTITFDSSLSFDTPLVQTAHYTIEDVLTINGPTNARLTIDAGNDHRHFTIDSGTFVTLTNLTLINGRATLNGDMGGGNGGSIYYDMGFVSTAALNLDSITIQDSNAISNSGALHIFNNSGGSLTVNLTNATLSHNTSAGNGGAISNHESTLNVINSTISGNDASSFGGAIYNEACSGSALDIRSSTIVENSADGEGGGIYSTSLCTSTTAATVAISNTILGGNASPPGTFNDCFSEDADAFTSSGFNLTTTVSQTGCTYEPSDQRIDPALILTQVVDPNLANNGGSTPTHALLPGSQAIDAGSCPSSTTDQRGVPRPLGAACDVGSYEANLAAIAVTKSVGVIDGACAPTSSIVVNQNTNVFYCVTIVNTGNVTLTAHGLSDPLLEVNQPLPMELGVPTELAPGAALVLTNNEISGFGPSAVAADITNSVTVTSTDGITTTTAAASATVHVPSIAVTKTVGIAPAGTGPIGCAATSDLEVNTGDDLVYCITIRNTGTTTLTSHTLHDPLLFATDVTVPFVLAPGAVVQINNDLLESLELPPVLGLRTVTSDVSNTATITSTAETAGVTATGAASASVNVRDLAICMIGFGTGTDTDVIRVITVTVFITPTASLAHCIGSAPGAPPADAISGINVGFEVTGGTPVGPNFQTTNAQGQAIFSYHSVAPPVSAEQAQATTADIQPDAVADTDVITVWVDLDEGLDFDTTEPWDLEEVPTVVTLASFAAVRRSDGTVTLFWRTAAETDNAGFNLYRSPLRDGLYVKVNDSLIAGQGTGSGSSYHYVDEGATSGSLYYKLEDVDTSGVKTLHGPVEVVDQEPTYLPNINLHP
ncbi:MAG: DUF11 domain-containing protein [Caldilineaceae bacterium]|nr:DUF11 domain-containing protein [Caldilineaceae bacterium]